MLRISTKISEKKESVSVCCIYFVNDSMYVYMSDKECIGKIYV